MMRSMYSGVSGLKVHQTKMDVIGNNIANVSTTGYKSQRVTFNEVFSQTIQHASASSDDTGRGGTNPMQVGLGVNISSIDVLMTAGAAQRTDNPFDLMIDGEGFIVVGDGAGTYFTKSGALRQDEDGSLITASGLKVKGWPATEDGKDIVRKEVEDIMLADVKSNMVSPELTTLTEISGNLNVNDDYVTTQLKMYDSMGNLFTTDIYMVYDKLEAKWNIYNQIDTSGDSPVFGTGDMILKNSDGFQYSVANPWGGGTGLTPADKTTNPPTAAQPGTPFNSFEFSESGRFKGISPVPDPPEKPVTYFMIGQGEIIDLSKATPLVNAKGILAPALTSQIGAEGVQVNLEKLTQYSANSNLNSQALDGRAAGRVTGYNVAGDGKIIAYYDNGQRKLIAQIVVAEFTNPAGLEKMGENLFKATSNSGDFDNIGKSSNFLTGVLEMSNVDLSTEFTEMITTQRGFQANSKIISSSDEMLQELVNLKR